LIIDHYAPLGATTILVTIMDLIREASSIRAKHEVLGEKIADLLPCVASQDVWRNPEARKEWMAYEI
jgi:hypothetical protein